MLIRLTPVEHWTIIEEAKRQEYVRSTLATPNQISNVANYNSLVVGCAFDVQAGLLTFENSSDAAVAAVQKQFAVLQQHHSTKIERSAIRR